jgi:phosphatidylserine/phosphatidylglycerophosphate/cardiolipin synthase-like enzyme
MVIDDTVGFVESLNWEPKDLTKTRDYAIVTTHGHEVAEMVSCFDADWEHKDFKPQSDSPLIWCPNNGRQRVAQFIDATQHTLWLQNERYQDQVIIERLVRAVMRGVKVHILAKPPHSLKPDKLIEGVGGLRILQDVGAKVHTLKHLKLHAKMFLADSERAIIGSINIAPGSFDSRRELAIETNDPKAVKRLEKVAQHDWDRSHKLDLSDAALLADLKKRAGLDPAKLVLYEDSEHWGYHHKGNNGNHGDKANHKSAAKHHRAGH